ncbi:MAG: N-6 DNA methylase [Burkholderiales bacterium]
MKTQEKTFLTRRIRELGFFAEQHRCDAGTVVGTVLAAWCRTDFPALPRPALPYSKALAAERKIVAFVETLQTLEFLEGAYWLSSLYATVADEDYRKKLAMFFTPPSLTKGLLDDLAEQGADFASQTFLDPACGGAAFLAPIALRMRAALLSRGATPRRVLRHIEGHLFGTDIDAALCELSKQFLRMALHDEIQKTGYLPEFKIHKADSLTELVSMFETIDVVVCNPPYRKMAADELKHLRGAIGKVIEVQPNLYGLFIGLSVRFLREGGYAALVTPTSFLSGQYFSKLRTFLLRNTDVAHIGMVSDRQGVFIDVEQETALTVVRRRAGSDCTQARAKVSVVSATGQYKGVGECLLPNAGAAWPIPRSDGDVALLKAATTSKFRLSDYGYRVRIGSYVWNRDKRPRYESIKDVKRAKAHTALPLLWSRDITAAGLVVFDDTGMTGDEHRFVDLGDKRHRSAVYRPSVVLQRVTSNDQPRRLVAAPVPSHLFVKYGGFIGENHIVILEQVEEKAALNVLDMSKLLATTPVDRYFRCISGATNVSAFEMRQLSLPDPQKLQAELNKGSSMEEAAHHSLGLAFGG